MTRADARRLRQHAWLLVGLALGLVLASGCASRQMRSLQGGLVDPETLYLQGMEALEKRSLRRARLSFEKIQYSAQDRARLEPLVRLALADTSFFKGHDLALIDARGAYLEFVTLYGDHPKAPYAQLQAGVCSLKQAANPSRDQSETRLAMEDLYEVLRRYPDSPYARAAQDLIRTAHGTLAEHEYVVGKFYLKRKSYEAATSRFKIVVDRYPTYPEKDKLFFQLGKSLILGNNAVEGRLYLDKLIADYPDGKWAKRARKLLATVSGDRGSE